MPQKARLIIRNANDFLDNKKITTIKKETPVRVQTDILLLVSKFSILHFSAKFKETTRPIVSQT